MARMKDPYLAEWNAAIEAAACQAEIYSQNHLAATIRALAKPDPIDDQWRRVNDGDCGVSHD